MFQLIVAVISIVLVAALAIASIFYGGDAFSKSSEKANVTALVNAGQQIAGAYTLFKTEQAAEPADLNDLVTNKYLAAPPSGGKAAHADGVWELDTSDPNNKVTKIQIKATAITDDVCIEANRQAGSTDGSAPANAQFGCVADGADVYFQFKL